MKLSNPNSRMKLNIPSNASVLDVGSGHNPHPRANVITDKFVDNNYHRVSNLKVLGKQKFVEADGESLPFKDKEFDYLICCHVVEHVDDPAKFLTELSRVGNAGYLEAPSLIGEFLIPKASHKWVLLELNNKIVLVEKERLGMKNKPDFGYLFLDYLPRNSFGFKILQRTQFQIFNVSYEWKNDIEFIVDPTDSEIMKYFTETWDQKMYEQIIPKRSMRNEYLAFKGATFDIFKSVFKSKLLSRLK
jgi:ubiquinone/menaquinone biosynthesis C-methylase UbiE